MRGYVRSAAAALLMAALSVLAVTAQTPNPAAPVMPAAGATVEALVPAGWSIEQRHDADFNGDGRADALLLLLRLAGAAEMPARIVLLAVATAKPPGYVRFAANDQLVPQDQSGRMEDPMADGEIVVRRGGFDLKVGMMPAIGSYQAATMRFRFRVDERCTRLIGFDRNETHRATLDTHDVSVNFLTGDVIEKSGNAQTGEERTTRKRLAQNPRRCLPDLPSAWTFDPLEISRR